MISIVSGQEVVPRAQAMSGSQASAAPCKAMAMPLPVNGGGMAKLSPMHRRPDAGA